ncbi:hypothetical protein BN1708_011403 [Verticillium longisporum]|uniref:Uncharacterized protein n=1 Tax=Verticillium longisporum TaxID=100787 RepID=A0A0G4L0L2_VERLO|nr:hypothetical protein BN1708_011403 [Verticillium longisporum]
MQVKSVLLGAALALATTTMAENEKPRIYFPRHVKRQFTNSTLSQHGTFPVPESTPFTSRPDRPTFITSLRLSLTSDLIEPAESSSSSSESLSEPSGTTQRTTVVISSTIRVPPTTVPEVPDPTQSSSEEPSAEYSTAPQPSPSSTNPETSTSQTTTEPDTTTASGTTTTEPDTTTTASGTTTTEPDTTTASGTTTTEPEPEPTTEASTTAETSPEQSTVVESVYSAVSATTTASVPITTDVSEPPVSANTTVPDQSTQPPVSLTSLPPVESSIIPSTSIFPGSSVIPSVSPSASASDEPSTIVPVTSLAPTHTITGTEIWLPSTIIVEHSTPTRAATDAVAPTSAVALPSDLPKVIGPGDTENVVQPEGTVLLQVGFLYAENYEFVSKNPMAAAQLFTLLPIALTDGAGIDAGKVIVTSLVPYDTMPSLGYITTLARFWYPKSMVDQLRMDIKIPNSRLYNNPQQLIYNLTQNINPAIDIIPGSENIPGGNGGAPKSGSPNGNNDMFNKKESNSTPIQTGTAAAIGIGAVTVGVAYGAAMFLIARRYKRKKQAHRHYTR